MRATRYSLALPFVAAALLISACGNTDNALNTRKGERVLVAWLDKQDMRPEKVVCPEDIKMVVGTVFVCQATIANSEAMVLDIEITTVSETGDVHYKHLTDKVVSKQVERGLRGGLIDQEGQTFDVNCGLRVRPLVPGKTFRCDAKDTESDKTLQFEVTMIAEAPFWSAQVAK